MEFPGWPVGKTRRSQCRGLRFVPGQRPKILHPTQCSLEKIIENEIIIAIIIIENKITIIEGRPQSVFLLRVETELPVGSGRKEKHIKDKSIETEEVNTVIIHK